MAALPSRKRLGYLSVLLPVRRVLAPDSWSVAPPRLSVRSQPSTVPSALRAAQTPASPFWPILHPLAVGAPPARIAIPLAPFDVISHFSNRPRPPSQTTAPACVLSRIWHFFSDGLLSDATATPALAL